MTDPADEALRKTAATILKTEIPFLVKRDGTRLETNEIKAKGENHPLHHYISFKRALWNFESPDFG